MRDFLLVSKQQIVDLFFLIFIAAAFWSGTHDKTARRHRVYILLLCMSAVCFLSEAGYYYEIEKPGVMLRQLVYLSDVLYYITGLAFFGIVAFYIYSSLVRERTGLFRKLFHLPLAVFSLIAIFLNGSAWKRVLFVGASCYYMVIIVVFLIKYSHVMDERLRKAIISVLAIVVLLIAFDFFVGNVVSGSTCLVIIDMAIFFGLENPDLELMLALGREREKAKQETLAKSAFLSNMSHEIRTPINAILGMDEMILRESEEEGTIRYAGNIKTAGNTLLGLINDILDFSKVEAGKMEIVPVSYQFSSLLNDLMNMVRLRAKEKGLSIDLKVNPSLPNCLHGDEIRVKQAATNVLTNAVKYTKEGGITIEVDYRTLPEENAIGLLFRVTDTGIGIREEDLGNIFQAYERFDEEKNRSIEGTGLGMNITQRMLQLMGSELQVESEYGKGSTFWFEVRQGVEDWKGIGDYEQLLEDALKNRKKYQESFTAPSARVLAVDDTPLNLMVFSSLLKNTLIQIDTAENGWKAISLARERVYDMIFLDHLMPDLDGMETRERIAGDPEGKNRHTPMVCLTANAMSGARENYLAAGFVDYLTKPIDPQTLEKMLQERLPEEKLQIGKTAEESFMEAFKEAAVEEQDADAAAFAEDFEDAYGDGSGESSDDFDLLRDIDVEEGILNCGSRDAYKGALEIFLEGYEAGREKIEAAIEMQNLESYTIRVHALKSSSRIIGADVLSGLSKELEQAGNDGDTGKILEKTPQLLALYEKICEDIRKCLLKNRPEAGEPGDAITQAQWQEALEAVRQGAQDLDYDSIEFTLDALKEYALSEEQEALRNKLEAALHQMDWDGILEKLKGVLA